MITIKDYAFQNYSNASRPSPCSNAPCSKSKSDTSKTSTIMKPCFLPLSQLYSADPIVHSFYISGTSPLLSTSTARLNAVPGSAGNYVSPSSSLLAVTDSFDEQYIIDPLTGSLRLVETNKRRGDDTSLVTLMTLLEAKIDQAMISRAQNLSDSSNASVINSGHKQPGDNNKSKINSLCNSITSTKDKFNMSTSAIISSYNEFQSAKHVHSVNKINSSEAVTCYRPANDDLKDSMACKTDGRKKLKREPKTCSALLMGSTQQGPVVSAKIDSATVKSPNWIYQSFQDTSANLTSKPSSGCLKSSDSSRPSDSSAKQKSEIEIKSLQNCFDAGSWCGPCFETECWNGSLSETQVEGPLASSSSSKYQFNIEHLGERNEHLIISSDEDLTRFFSEDASYSAFSSEETLTQSSQKICGPHYLFNSKNEDTLLPDSVMSFYYFPPGIGHEQPLNEYLNKYNDSEGSKNYNDHRKKYAGQDINYNDHRSDYNSHKNNFNYYGNNYNDRVNDDDDDFQSNDTDINSSSYDSLDSALRYSRSFSSSNNETPPMAVAKHNCQDDGYSSNSTFSASVYKWQVDNAYQSEDEYCQKFKALKRRNSVTSSNNVKALLLHDVDVLTTDTDTSTRQDIATPVTEVFTLHGAKRLLCANLLCSRDTVDTSMLNSVRCSNKANSKYSLTDSDSDSDDDIFISPSIQRSRSLVDITSNHLSQSSNRFYSLNSQHFSQTSLVADWFEK